MLEIRGLRKTFGAGKVALDGVSFAVPAGQMFGFVGANGAGKTTTMRIVMKVLAADEGEVIWNGRPLTFTERRTFGYMPEERGLYQKMRVGEQIDYFGRLHGLDAATVGKSRDALVERLGLTARVGDTVESLSLGNQQRVQLAVALIHDPELLILDEPFSGLDPIAVDVLAEVLHERARGGVPVIFSSHQLELVERLCDAVGIVSAGRMVASGTVDELRDAEGRRLRVVVRDAKPGWAEGLPGELSKDGDRDVLTVVGGDDQTVLRKATEAGHVEFFGVERPTLVEIFREAVA
ncbi:ABC transporter ATP-binding protein [Herbidospora mongoliensis]|uniref:ABC transporter ATP-binding protein n=1 Tax=Herbidospora mongoliensis TaxID=688067 RepID=UPI0008297AE1|nr:ATP-binding cassette domain-containing protein [Herbidospora mongoliensis]